MTAETRPGTVAGLTGAEVAERVARGQTNVSAEVRSRSFVSILKTNTFTYFNALIGTLWVLMLASAPLIDSLFGLVIVINTAIGVVQEWRASRTLAKLSVVGRARPSVVRDGAQSEVDPEDLVLDDVIVLRTGDQLLVDGSVLSSDGMEIDESLLTGEADPVDKSVGDEAMSGSFVVAGSGLMRAEKVGFDSYAAKLTVEAKQFSTTHSELASSIQRFIRIVSYALIPIGILLFISQYRANDGKVRDSIAGTVPGVVTLVPEGLVLMTSIAMAVSVIRLAQRRVLVQDMPAVEVLARVDVVCVDKTGTLTQPGMRLREVVALDEQTDPKPVVAALGHAEAEPNPTLTAIVEKYPSSPWRVTANVPFSSARKWSAASFEGHGAYVLGAPELLLPDGDPVRARADELASDGARVLLVASVGELPSADGGVGEVQPIAFAVIDQQLRPDAADTVRYFHDQNVIVKVISGDNPVTVAAIAEEAGIPAGEGGPVDARHLPEDPDRLDEMLERSHVFGRVTPAQKRAMVGALQRKGHTVAMTGDGVNDVLALKDADLGIAMGSGAGATRAAAQIVLLDNAFSVMPSVVAEGRRVLGNIARVSDLFLTKSVYAMVVSITTVLLTLQFPFLNRHLTIVTAFTIGIPSFFLALMPNNERFRPGFFRRVMVFAIPAGIVCALSAYAAYGLTLNGGGGVGAARANASYTLFVVAWWVLLQVARPWNWMRLLIVFGTLLAFVAIMSIPWLSRLFALDEQSADGLVQPLIVGAIGAVLVTIVRVVTDRWRRAPVEGYAATVGTAG